MIDNLISFFFIFYDHEVLGLGKSKQSVAGVGVGWERYPMLKALPLHTSRLTTEHALVFIRYIS
jgi:hypothetical protein